MQRIAFIDHAYHRVTRSADFFVDVLRTRFDVTVYYAGTQAADLVDDIVMAGFDIVVLWQSDYMAPLFLAAGQRTVCVPMYDGTGLAPDSFWRHMTQTRVISFSHAMHTRLTGLGLTSMPVRYMKNPLDFAPVTDYDTPRAVFWQRLPERGLHAPRVREMLGGDVTLHVHNAPDLASPDDWPALPAADTVSYFDLQHNALADAMGNANIFVAPRYAEGIGMAMLEAMARGMVVIAHDAPTHNEYLRHGANGLLTDLSADGNPAWPIDLTGTTPQRRTPVDRATLGLRDRATARLRDTAERGINTAVDRLMASQAASRVDPRVLKVLGQVTNDPKLNVRRPLDAADIAAHMARLGEAARASAATLHIAWAGIQREMLDFIEETPAPTGIRLSRRARTKLARDTEVWLNDPERVIALMHRWEAHGIVLRDRSEMTWRAAADLRLRQTVIWRVTRITLRTLRNTLRAGLRKLLRR